MAQLDHMGGSFRIISPVSEKSKEWLRHTRIFNDNACIESFHSIIKKELIHHENYPNRDIAKLSILEYIVSFYNYKRIHSYLGYLSPIAFEKQAI